MNKRTSVNKNKSPFFISTQVKKTCLFFTSCGLINQKQNIVPVGYVLHETGRLIIYWRYLIYE